MKKVLFVSKDSSNPIVSGYNAAKQWAGRNAPEGWFITSHLLGSRTNKYQDVEQTYAYEVCVDED